MNYKNASTLSTILAILGVVIALIDSSNTIFICFAVLFIIAGAVIKLAFYRCPYCEELLPWRSLTPQYCPHCGERLEPERDHY